VVDAGPHLTCCYYGLSNENVAIAVAAVAVAVVVEIIVIMAATGADGSHIRGADGSRIRDVRRREMMMMWMMPTSDRVEIRCSQFDRLTKHIVHYCTFLLWLRHSLREFVPKHGIDVHRRSWSVLRHQPADRNSNGQTGLIGRASAHHISHRQISVEAPQLRVGSWCNLKLSLPSKLREGTGT
jgi:hypothetical protein